MIGKRLRWIIWHLIFEYIWYLILLIFCILKKKKYVQLISQKLIRIMKKKQFYQLFQTKKTRSKENFYIIKRNNIKKSWWYLLFQLYSFIVFIHSFTTEGKLKFPEKVYKNKDFCGIVIASEKDNLFKIWS